MLPRPTLIIDYILAVSSHAVSGEEFRNPFFFNLTTMKYGVHNLAPYDVCYLSDHLALLTMYDISIEGIQNSLSKTCHFL